MSAIQIIFEPPKFVCAEEHGRIVETTPASFGDIPPVLRHRQDGIKIEFDPPAEGLSADELSNGTLYLVESALAFMPCAGKGFQVLYPSITIHAVSKSGSSPIVYCQLERPLPDDGEDAEDDDIQTIELKIVPSDASTVDPIFEALSYCASLHPNPNMEDEYEDEDSYVNTDGFETFTGEDGEELSDVGRVRSHSTNNNRYLPY